MKIRHLLQPGRGLALLAAAAALSLQACGKKDVAAKKEEAAAVDYAAIAAAAVADAGRPEEDLADDERRRPAAALAYMELRPGLAVFEIEAGGGWYTELFSRAVGEKGSVVMQNPQGFVAFLGDKVAKRLEGDRLANVRPSVSNFDALDAPDLSVDLVTWVQGPHELYYTPESGSLGDPAKSYAEIARILKPGGLFVAIDHSAEEGAPEKTGHDLHRVDKAIVKRMAEAAGLKFVSESGFLANPEDPLTTPVFDPAIRGHTDQFALKFRKD